MADRSAGAIVVLAAALFGSRFIGLSGAQATTSSSDLDFVTVRTVTTQVAGAHDVILSSYLLAPTGAMTRALCAAAAHGGRVHVVLDGSAFGSAAAMNERSTALLRQAGVRVEFTRAPLHAKAAVVDGRIYLTDRNWTRSRAELVLEDRAAADEPIVLRAITGTSGANGRLTTRKTDSLVAEAAIIARGSGHDVAVETESFGLSTRVDEALLARRRRGDRVRLLVDEREYRGSPLERDQLAALVRHGIEVRVGRSGEKLAVDGASAWIGSANATPGLPDQVDWGITLPASLAGNISRQFEANWTAAATIGAAS